MGDAGCPARRLGGVGVARPRLAEELPGERRDAVLGAGGVQAVGGERDVEGGARQCDAAAGERHAQRLQVRADLRDGEVAEHGREGGEHGRRLGRPHDVHRLRRARDGERRQTRRRGAPGVEPPAERERSGSRERGQGRGHLRRRGEGATLHLQGLPRRDQLAEQGMELELEKQRPEARGVGAFPAQGLDVEGDRHVAPDRGQGLRQASGLGLAGERRADLLRTPEPARLHVVEVLEDPLDRPEPRDERARRLLADALDSRDVVDRVPHEAHHVGDERRVDPEAGTHLRGAEAAVAHGVEEGRPLVDQLHHVLVAGDDHGLEPGGARLRGERADHVVGLHARDFDHRQAEGVDDPADVAELGAELVRERGTVLLVLGVQAVAKCLTRRVEHDRRVARLLLPEQLRKHVSEAEGRVGGEPPRRAEPRERVERPVDVTAAVDQVEARPAPRLRLCHPQT